MRFILLFLVLIASGCQSLFIVKGPNRNVSTLVVEVDWTTPQPPTQSFLNSLTSSIQGIVDPSVSVVVSLDDDLSSSGHTTWSKDDCRMFSAAHRDTDGLYVIWANGRLDGLPQAGGYSWDKRNTVVFQEVVGTGGMAKIAVVHELLHCLGLTGKYLKMQEMHQHAYGNHCNVSGCVMQPSTYGSIPCAKCVADLTAGEEK